MAVKLNDFLTNYFKQLHFDNMSENVRAAFEDHVKKDDLIGHMKDWNKNLNGKPLPSFADIKDSRAFLFDEIRDAIQSMEETQDIDKHADVKEFLEEYKDFFIPEKSNLLRKDEIKDILDNERFANIYEQAVKDVERGYYGSDPDIKSRFKRYGSAENFKKILLDPDNQADKKLQEDFDIIIKQRLEEYGFYSEEADNKNKAFNRKLRNLWEKLHPEPTDAKLDEFEKMLPMILQFVYDSKKLREAMGGTIVASYDKARDLVDYDKSDSECFIKGKSDDELTRWQKLKKDVKDWADDHIENHLYRSLEAKEIMGAVKKVGIKKTDGLDKILSEADKIKAKAVSKRKKSGSHFDWVVKELKKLKEDQPEAFKGCLNNGAQLSSIAQQLMYDAASQDKIDEAKTLMEMLIDMQYGNTTSGLMDKIRGDKELFTLFSDSNMSYMKNGNVVTSSIMKGLDATIRIGGLAVGYGVTWLYNNARQMGKKIDDKKGNKFFKAAEEKWTKGEKADAKYKRYQGMVDNASEREKGYKDKLDGFEKEGFDKAKKEEEIKNTEAKAEGLLEDIKKTCAELAQEFQEYYADALPDEVAKSVWKYFEDVNKFLIHESEEIPELPVLDEAKYPGLIADYKKLNEKLKTYKEQGADLNKSKEMLDAFNEATEGLKAAEKQRKEYQEKIEKFEPDKKNKFDALKKYWNELVTDSRLFGKQRSWIFRGAKKAQGKYLESLGRAA